MPRKPKRTSKAAKASKSTKPSKSVKRASVKKRAATAKAGDFLVVRVPRELRPGQSLAVLEIAESEKASREWVAQLTDSSPALLMIVERKAVLERRPQMVVKEIKEGN